MNKFVEKMELIEKQLSIFLFLAMLSILTIQIVSRYFLTIALPWTEELSRWLYIYIVFIGASEAISRRDHIAVDIVPNRLSKKANLILDICIHLLFAVIAAIIVYRGYLFTIRMDRLSSITMDVKMSMLYGVIPVGFVLVTIKSSLNTAMSLMKLVKLTASPSATI